MKLFDVNTIDARQYSELTKRPAINFESTLTIVKPIVEDVKAGGIQSVLRYAQKFDKFVGTNLFVTKEEFAAAEMLLEERVKTALRTAYENISKFHVLEIPKTISVDTMEGISCSREFRPIDNVGLYIPGGSAVLPSTVLMLGIPAQLAGCRRVVLSTPVKGNNIHPAVLYAAQLCGITEIIKAGGVQAIALMAYGDKDFKKVDKIFGPGNQYVTAAKLFVSIDAAGCAIDMPAGPSEVLVIADNTANPKFIAADLLSQAEHGKDSQVILVTTSPVLASAVENELIGQLSLLPRKEIAEQALSNSFTLLTNTLDEAIEFSNAYAPEHLILHIQEPTGYTNDIINAGSVFLGAYSPESVGDYASGTNHSLPTYGYARSFGGVSVESFMKTVTFQSLTKAGLQNIASTVETLAEIEELAAHKNAVSIRLGK